MAAFLMPISLLVKQYITITSNIYLSELPAYLFGILVLYNLFLNNRRKTMAVRELLDTRMIIIFILVFIVQFMAMTITYISTADKSYLRTPFRGMLTLSTLVLFALYYYFIVKVMVKSERDIELFLRGSIISTLLILLVTYTQQLYLMLPHSEILNNVVSFFGKYFEARDVDAGGWYFKGSYVQTVHRINGFFTESAMLAAQIAIICLPFILASIKNQYNVISSRKYSATFYHLLAILLLGMLLLAKTSTGILAIIVAAFSFWIVLERKRKVIYGVAFIFCLIFVLILYRINANFNTIINSYVFGKSDSYSTNNRIGNSIALFLTFLHRPLFGTGYGYTYHYLLQLTPEWSIHNREYLNFITVRHNIPHLSVFLSWLAQFGMIIVSLFVIYIIKLQRDLYSLVKKINSESYKLYKSIADSAYFFFFQFFVLSLFNFGWHESSFLLMLFFFVAFRQYLYNEIYHKPFCLLESLNVRHFFRWMFFKKRGNNG